MNTAPKKTRTFGKRNEPHTVVVMRNGKSRVFTINPILLSVGLCFLFMLGIGYLGATAYLIFRDDLIESSISRHARMQHEYEDRIAILRSKLDRITSRQLLDQQQIESQVSELLARQASIGNRTSKMDALLEKAEQLGLRRTTGTVPIPVANPQKTQKDALDRIETGAVPATKKNAEEEFASAFSLRGIGIESGDHTKSIKHNKEPGSLLLAYSVPSIEKPISNKVFGRVARAIGNIDASQRNEIDSLRLAAAEKTREISKILSRVSSAVPKLPESDVGGPFVPLDHSVEFAVHLDALEDTLELYDEVAGLANALPLKNPVPGAAISSRYGTRIDPFNGRRAMHGGVDFRAPTGTPVRSTGAGVVTKAGRLGGYGKIVEIKHRDGLISRYAHLSSIKVRIGQKIKAGQTIGKVGSTGRSTGPHLHYEVRQGGKTRNPDIYMRTGYKLRGLI